MYQYKIQKLIVVYLINIGMVVIALGRIEIQINHLEILHICHHLGAALLGLPLTC